MDAFEENPDELVESDGGGRGGGYLSRVDGGGVCSVGSSNRKCDAGIFDTVERAAQEGRALPFERSRFVGVPEPHFARDAPVGGDERLLDDHNVFPEMGVAGLDSGREEMHDFLPLHILVECLVHLMGVEVCNEGSAAKPNRMMR